ncbi:hypothetical protein SDC9_125100 [bioreactor metagenome]|uniref:Uncharacterized protein n=1 Tax=bioreactor metagenome TaxID=1076179 RepID=A0A645CM09_9ZZZZ
MAALLIRGPVKLHGIGDVALVVHARVWGVVIKFELRIYAGRQRAVHIDAIVAVDTPRIAVGSLKRVADGSVKGHVLKLLPLAGLNVIPSNLPVVVVCVVSADLRDGERPVGNGRALHASLNNC